MTMLTRLRQEDHKVKDSLNYRVTWRSICQTLFFFKVDIIYPYLLIWQPSLGNVIAKLNSYLTLSSAFLISTLNDH